MNARVTPWDSAGHSRHSLHLMAPYELHKRLINDYLLCCKGATSLLQRDTSKDRTDYDIIRENHKFLWDDNDHPDTWEAQLSKKYYDKLFKEYCICDLRMYKSNKVAMRWRTEAELVSGRGQFTCGEKHCTARDGLRTWEVNFAYEEQGVKKNALVKLRLCSDCSSKLNFGSKKREIKRIHNKKSLRKKLQKERENKKTEDKQNLNTEAAVAESTTSEEKNDKEESNLWKDTAKPDEEKAREDEFEEYLEDLFL